MGAQAMVGMKGGGGGKDGRKGALAKCAGDILVKLIRLAIV